MTTADQKERLITQCSSISIMIKFRYLSFDELGMLGVCHHAGDNTNYRELR